MMAMLMRFRKVKRTATAVIAVTGPEKVVGKGGIGRVKYIRIPT